jgi:hypothetical protein
MTNQSVRRVANFVVQNTDGDLLHEVTHEFSNPDPSFRTDEAIESFGRGMCTRDNYWVLVSITG